MASMSRHRAPYPQWLYGVYDQVQLIRRFFFLRARLSSPTLAVPPLFIIGSGRSGNTLLRAILYQHPAFCIPPESYVLGDVVRWFRMYSFLPWPTLSAAVLDIFETHPQFHTWEIDLRELRASVRTYAPPRQTLADLLDALYRYYHAIKKPEAVRWGDKTPLNTFYVDRIHSVFPGAQYIHILRDGRDVVASYLGSGHYDSLELACRRWQISIRRAQRFARSIGERQYMEIRYEDLVSTPEETIRGLADFLNVEFIDVMLRPQEIAGDLGDTHLPHHANVANPISTASIGRWKHELTDEQQAILMRELGSDLDSLRYT